MILLVTMQVFSCSDYKAANCMPRFVIVSSFNGTIQYLNV
jgi:hypothetical protein